MPKDELVLQSSGLVPLVEENGLGELIKPLVNEIHLFDSFIAGTTHLDDRSVLDDF